MSLSPLANYARALSKYTVPGVARHLQLGGTIWLNPSKKLFSLKEYFFVKWKDLPLHVKREFEHHSHTHPNVTVTSTSTTHQHTFHNSGGKVCGYSGSTSHVHPLTTDYVDGHTHDFTVSFDAANLGSPWWNHAHNITLVSETNGGVEHTHVQTPEANECDACTDHGHIHANANSGSGGGAHSDHATSASTSTGSGTAEVHIHTFSFTSGSGGSHNHTSTALAAAACYRTASHPHTGGVAWATKLHTHTVAGTSGSGGEPEVPAGGLFVQVI